MNKIDPKILVYAGMEIEHYTKGLGLPQDNSIKKLISSFQESIEENNIKETLRDKKLVNSLEYCLRTRITNPGELKRGLSYLIEKLRSIEEISIESETGRITLDYIRGLFYNISATYCGGRETEKLHKEAILS